MHERGPSRCGRVLKMITVEPVVFCFMFGSYLQFTAFLSLTYGKSCLALFNTTFCDAMDNKTFQEDHKTEQDDIQAESSYWLMVTNVALAVPSILSVFLFMGPWGDKVDRKLPLLFPCAGAFFYNLSNLFNANFVAWPIPALLPGLALNGLAGGYITMLMASYSYITHISKQEDRTVRVGIVGSSIYMAATISVFISGLLVEAVGHVIVFGIVCGLMGFAFFYGLLFLKSVVPEKQDKEEGNSWCDTFVLSTVRETWAFLQRPRPGNQKMLMILEIAILNIVHMATSGEGDILYLYLKRSPRSFSRAQYGYFKGAENFTRSLALLTLLPLFKRKFGVSDTAVVIVGLIFKTMTLMTLGFAQSLVVVFLAAIPAVFQGFPASGLRSSMASRVDKGEHGRLFAVVAASQSCVTLATTFIFNGWYPHTLDYFDGTCFMFAAGMCILAACVAVFVHSGSRKEATSDQTLQEKSAPKYETSKVYVEEMMLTHNEKVNDVVKSPSITSPKDETNSDDDTNSGFESNTQKELVNASGQKDTDIADFYEESVGFSNDGQKGVGSCHDSKSVVVYDRPL